MINQGNSDGNNVETAGEENNGISYLPLYQSVVNQLTRPTGIIFSGKDEKGTKKDGEQENKVFRRKKWSIQE